MSRPVYEPSLTRADAELGFGSRQLFRRPGSLGSGMAIYKIKVDEDHIICTTGDRFGFAIPEDLDDAVLVKVEAWVTTPSSSGTIEIQVRNDNGPADMLSTLVSIDAGEENSRTAVSQHVVNLANAQVAWADELWIEVTADGTGAMGLGMTLYFSPLAGRNLVLEGAQGPPGGVTQFEGPWQTATTYVAGDVVTHNNVTYLVTENHISSATTEPGVGVDWEDFLAPLIDIPLLAAIEVFMDGRENVLSTGIKTYVEVPFDCEITEATMLARPSGSVVVDIWKDTYANHPPTDADSITASAPPTITTGVKSKDTTLSGWTTALSEGDILAFNVDSCSVISQLTLSLKLLRTP